MIIKDLISMRDTFTSISSNWTDRQEPRNPITQTNLNTASPKDLARDVQKEELLDNSDTCDEGILFDDSNDVDISPIEVLCKELQNKILDLFPQSELNREHQTIPVKDFTNEENYDQIIREILLNNRPWSSENTNLKLEIEDLGLYKIVESKNTYKVTGSDKLPAAVSFRLKRLDNSNDEAPVEIYINFQI